MSVLLLRDMAQTSATAASAFCASNLDDILLLLLLFSGADDKRARWHVVAGQYLGFTLLVLASLLGFLGGQFLSQEWTGVLGLFPVGLGVSQIIDSLQASQQGCDQSPVSSDSSTTEIVPAWVQRLGIPCTQMFAVASLTVANGGDNLGLYMPLFAQVNLVQLSTTLVVFFLLVGVWCLTAWRLLQAPGLAGLINRYGQQVVPLVLVGLGLMILVESHTFSSRPLSVMVLSALMAMAWAALRQVQSLTTDLSPNKVG